MTGSSDELGDEAHRWETTMFVPSGSTVELPAGAFIVEEEYGAGGRWVTVQRLLTADEVAAVQAADGNGGVQLRGVAGRLSRLLSRVFR